MKRATEFLAVLILLVATGSAQSAIVLWYNGDTDAKSTTPNQVIQLSQPGAVPFDDFNVTGQVFLVQTVFTNNAIDDLAKMTGEARWEIRTGVSGSSGGSIVDRGVGPASFQATGRTVSGNKEYTVTVSGLNLQLTPNPYWLSVAPVSVDGSVHSFLTSTVGAMSIGTPPGNNGNAFSINVQTNASIALTGDYSMGVTGLLPVVIPEPSSMALVGLASAAFGGSILRRRRALAASRTA
jgi:hypothetical protein